MGSAKSEILRAVRAWQRDGSTLPSLEEPWTRYAEPREKFDEVLTSVGGKMVVVAGPSALETALEQVPAYTSGKKIASNVAGVRRANVKIEEIVNPHQLADVEVAIVAGEFAVAENGAVWVTDEHLRHRVLPFLSQHLVLVVQDAKMVNNLHEAFKLISFNKPGYGVFISGPSKTADIEQSLVIGAHGARSLHVMLVEPG